MFKIIFSTLPVNGALPIINKIIPAKRPITINKICLNFFILHFFWNIHPKIFKIFLKTIWVAFINSKRAIVKLISMPSPITLSFS